MNDPRPYRHKSIRLKEYDYTQAGSYFITICTHNQECLFGNVVDEEMQLNRLGEIVVWEWARTGDLRPTMILDAYIVMPNHFHAIIELADDTTGTRQRAATTGMADTPQRAGTAEGFRKPVSNSIPTIIRGFKAATTLQINQLRNLPGSPLWQRNYYEHIVRYEEELSRLREYTVYNAHKWRADSQNPENIKSTSKK